MREVDGRAELELRSCEFGRDVLNRAFVERWRRGAAARKSVVAEFLDLVTDTRSRERVAQL